MNHVMIIKEKQSQKVVLLCKEYIGQGNYGEFPYCIFVLYMKGFLL